MTDHDQHSEQQLAAPTQSATSRVRGVVGIGASAGGLAALRAFFATVPPDTELAFVVVVHLSPRGESHLAELLQPYAKMPVTQVTDTQLLEPDHVYVIPPGRNLSAIDSHLRLTPIEPERRVPIDHFFRTLADTHDGHSIGVILTGTGTDGADGVRHIRDAGGLVIVQDPREAEYDGMPRNAITLGLVDVVSPIAEIIGHVLAFVGTHPRVTSGARPADTDGEQADVLQDMLAVVRARTGHDFLRYKRATVARRVARRMQIVGLEQLADYLELLRDSDHEASALLDDLLINVTSFFRDAEVFRTLERDVVPKIFEGKGPRDRVRVWSMGCSTGEEAYSVAMLLLEEAARRTDAPQVQVFASDLHDRSLRHAREGLYPAAIADDIPAERLVRFFTRLDATYRVRKELRDVVVFAAHNLLQDPPFSRLDLIVCRNVLIYLQADAQRDVIELFHYSLHGPGYLLLGTAETLDRPELFRLEDRDSHLYQRREVPRGTVPLPAYTAAAAAAVQLREGTIQSRPRAASSYGTVHQTMLERHAPPSLLVDRDDNVVHLSETAGRYLQHPGGPPTTNAFRMVREELRAEMRAALHAALRPGKAMKRGHRSRPVPVSIDGELRQVVLRVSQAGPDEDGAVALVVFDELDEAAGQPGPDAVGPALNDAAMLETERQLELARNRLQTVLEEFETNREEMRAANEELQSANEELRSTMEELETSREELQSMNEELQTLNQENKHKVEELSQISNDLQNLLQANDVATIFLDRTLRILRFTPRVAEIFSVRHSDRGRPLEDLTHRLGYGGLIADAVSVLQTLVPIEREVANRDGNRWFVVRLTPYRTMDDRIEGVVITLVDVTPLKLSEKVLRENEQTARDVLARDDLRRQLASAEEGERRRLARELHDEVGQHLAALGLGLQALSDAAPPGSDVDRRAAQLHGLVDTMGRELHEIAVRLRPRALDDFGLALTLEAYAEEWTRRSGIPVEVHAQADTERLPEAIESTIYRIVQEALTNVSKHSAATRAGVVVERRDGSVVAIVEDNGCGFDPTRTPKRRRAAGRDAETTALGLLGIRERVQLLRGTLELESHPGKGTTLFVRIPIEGQAVDETVAAGERDDG